MTANGWFQLAFYMIALLTLAKPLGAYMARVFENRPCGSIARSVPSSG